MLEFVIIKVLIKVCPRIIGTVKKDHLKAMHRFLPLVEPLFKGVLGNQAIYIHIDCERKLANLEDLNQVVFKLTLLVENDHVLNQIKIKEGAIFLWPCLTDLEQKHSRSVVDVEALDAVYFHRFLILKAPNACLLEYLLE